MNFNPCAKAVSLATSSGFKKSFISNIIRELRRHDPRRDASKCHPAKQTRAAYPKLTPRHDGGTMGSRTEERMRIAFALTLGAALLAGSAASAAVAVVGNGTAKTCYSEAETGWDVKFGIKMCDDALKTETLSMIARASALITRGILKARADDVDGALRDYADALAIGENMGEAYLNRSATVITLRRFDEAKSYSDAAISLVTGRGGGAGGGRAGAGGARGGGGAAGRGGE